MSYPARAEGLVNMYSEIVLGAQYMRPCVTTEQSFKNNFQFVYLHNVDFVRYGKEYDHLGGLVHNSDFGLFENCLHRALLHRKNCYIKETFLPKKNLAQSAGTVKYTDCISAEG